MQDGTSFSPSYPQETTLPFDGVGNVFDRGCPTRKLLDRIGDKWSVLVLLSLSEHDVRFSDLKRRIGGISQKMLTQTLRLLERDGLIDRAVEPTVPISVTYSVTELGRELIAVLRLMTNWAESHMTDVLAAQRQYDARSE